MIADAISDLELRTLVAGLDAAADLLYDALTFDSDDNVVTMSTSTSKVIRIINAVEKASDLLHQHRYEER
jgi:hypothetical protein